MYVRLKAAHLEGRRVMTSAAILAETLRGEARDAGIHRVLGGVVVEPVTREIGECAGKLIGSAGLATDQAVDAMVAATALAQAGPVLIVTSDVPHLICAGRRPWASGSGPCGQDRLIQSPL
ncbi:type II toxin-antitoxin system VapC family toxin [Nonomuraea turcica]|uniref:type II toxin-antitoxin system VapC family toxin n=1 Tax=Nonomuraea sp. G32 TaxID=3067274 RepID=UPI00273B7D97|nr:hypothetical protein [Nonomuraea sp. G32]MDP4507217.1 hypothetical protein [Nonomuraea sp. G32]